MSVQVLLVLLMYVTQKDCGMVDLAKGKGRFLFWKESGVLLTLVISQSFPCFRNLQDGKDLVRKFQQRYLKK